MGGDIELPFPAKILWPNGRGHRMAKHRAFQKHKEWAWAAALAQHWHGYIETCRPERLKWAVTVYPKPRGPFPDKDNTIAALKAYQDGISKAIGLDDRAFDIPSLSFAERTQHGKIVVRIEP